MVRLPLPALAALALLGAAAPAAPAPGRPPTVARDPLGSPLWALHAARLFAGAPVVFDPAVRVALPVIAENQHIFPVAVDARALGGVRRIVILADLNPIPVAVDFAPGGAAPWLALRIKLDQRTPVRAAVLAGDGRWHVSGAWVDAAGGGCSAPPVSRARGDWAEHLGELRGAAFATPEGTRLRFTVRHPMDTGLVENVPAYHVETVTVAMAGHDPARLTVWGAVAEDPAFTLLFPGRPGAATLHLRDSNGREFSGRVPGPDRP
ncbi:quinoprotein dehydrogenase-associated SoxYZ-like carrier [Novosphingobium piscinae]|uniref:Quinoprotein dehydrogenase-associated SoxYZ-like carrier n=1 Tax=Novosphingobium piscinae TaxID=1507448 RepID=A0A7X1KQY2_9SPHN|nr:quinoprotein dehydrogenase-associated SoxYZ-like carrier [Novosphingobium piscinae]MBC2670095.1 quinoprotein dehydrogenase-associated SoxYZ-like carrier [Novosphingobium piscinae]